MSYVDVDVDGIAVKGVCDPDAAPAVGERVRLGCTTARVHLFDRATEPAALTRREREVMHE